MREPTRSESMRHPRESSFISLLSGWAQQGVQSYFATQRILLDLAMRQNASVIHAVRDRLSDSRHSPAAILTEVAGEGISSFIHAQQVLADLIQRQNDIVMAGARERAGGPGIAFAAIDLLRRTVDNAIDMQKQFLKAAGKQNHAWIESVKEGKLPKPEIMVDFAREAMETFVEAEKKFLDVVAEEVTKATSPKHNGAAKKQKKTELAELARQATEAFVEAQKKLFDVAGHQMNVNFAAAGRAMDIAGPLPLMPISDLTRDGVKTFVDAQRALMEAVTKTRGEAKHAKPHQAKKRGRGKTAHTEHAVV
ncbi:MAG TPA: hypothetical protein VFA68_19425 [Terriglobales bacterium]|nr:hypothetical protein [Terriglobales bacterium]